MAWTLIEELVRVIIVLVVEHLVTRGWRVMEGMKTCKIEGCHRTANRRGLCMVCYGKAKAKVDAKETTWEKLVERGLCEAERDPFDDAYSRAMGDS